MVEFYYSYEPSKQKRALGDRTRYSAARRSDGDDPNATTLSPWILHASLESRRQLSLIIKFVLEGLTPWSPHGWPCARTCNNCDNSHQTGSARTCNTIVAVAPAPAPAPVAKAAANAPVAGAATGPQQINDLYTTHMQGFFLTRVV